jgi:hypothetical protein
VLVYRDAPEHGPSTDSAFHVAFSTDEGTTWTADDTTPDGEAVAGFPRTRPEADVSDATVKHHRGDLLFHVSEERDAGGWRGTRQLRSTDGGHTWTDEGILDPAGIDPESLLLGQDDATHPETGDLYEGVYVTDSGSRPLKSGVVRTADGGRSWEYVGDVTDFDDDTNEIGLVFVDGDLLAVLRHGDTAATYARRSPDGGETWGPLRDVTDSLGVLQRARPYTAADLGAGREGWLYVVGRHVVPGRSQHTAVAASPDAGATWHGPFDLDRDGDGGYCDLLGRSDGEHCLVTYGGPSASDADLRRYRLGDYSTYSE